MSKRVYYSLIEYVVVAGCDRDTGLKIIENQVERSIQIFTSFCIHS